MPTTALHSLAVASFLACASCRAAPAQQAPECAAEGEAGAADPWPEVVASREALRRAGRFGLGIAWTELQYDRMELAVAVEELPTDGESYIDVYAYVFNRRFREWRRFLAAQVRCAGQLDIRVDASAGTLQALGAANNELGGKALLTFDLRAVRDDR